MEKNKKGIILEVIVLVLILAAMLYTPIKQATCKHEHIQDVVRVENTCVESGLSKTICDDCHKVLKTFEIEPTGHDYEKVLIEPATKNKDGLYKYTCKKCNHSYTEVYKCPHTHTHKVVVKEPTCEETGLEVEVCDECETEIKSNELPKLEHQFGDWLINVYATPTSDGEKIRTCSLCGKSETMAYSFVLANNSVYIPGTGINHHFTIAPIEQWAVDTYDIIYGYEYERGYGENDPYILGHNYNTLNKLPKTQVGQKIYINVNGNIETYEVQISEYAYMNEEYYDFFGTKSGLSVYTNLGAKTLHLYTCYGSDTRGRWLVLATLV